MHHRQVKPIHWPRAERALLLATVETMKTPGNKEGRWSTRGGHRQKEGQKNEENRKEEIMFHLHNSCMHLPRVPSRTRLAGLVDLVLTKAWERKRARWERDRNRKGINKRLNVKRIARKHVPHSSYYR